MIKLNFDHTEQCRYRLRFQIMVDFNPDLVYATPLVRHDDKDIEKKLELWANRILSLAEAYGYHGASWTIEKVPYKG